MSRTPLPIRSLQNDRVKALVRLRTLRERRKAGLTIIEEPLVIERARAGGVEFAEVWFCPEQEAPATTRLREEIAAAAPCVFEVPAAVMDRISYREHSAGLLAVIPIRVLELEELELPADPAPLLVVIENLEKPGNLGAVLRVADGAGADAVLVCGEGTDLDNPNVLRASRGASFHVPCLATDGDRIREFLSGRGIRILATSPDAETDWATADLTGPVALVLGAEHDGLSESWLAAADLRVALPMRGIGDSLNISTTAAILLYECVRQRSGPGKANR